MDIIANEILFGNFLLMVWKKYKRQSKNTSKTIINHLCRNKWFNFTAIISLLTKNIKKECIITFFSNNTYTSTVTLIVPKLRKTQFARCCNQLIYTKSGIFHHYNRQFVQMSRNNYKTTTQKIVPPQSITSANILSNIFLFSEL